MIAGSNPASTAKHRECGVIGNTAVSKTAILGSTPSARADGTLAQLVEQRTENPCVPGSIPGSTTKKIKII